MTQNLAEAIIQGEDNGVHFEEFCRELCQKVEGLPLVPTSRTYDQGRDAVSIASSKGTHKLVVCATIDKTIETKVARDAKHLTETSNPERVLYCYNGRLSEHAIDALVRTMKSVLPTETTVTFLSLQQLAALAVQHPDIFKAHYPAELNALAATLERFENGSEQSDASLKLALMTLASEDARLLRDDISQKAVLQVMSHGGMPMSSSDIAYHLSKDLRLPQSINRELIDAALTSLTGKEYVKLADGLWSLTPAGEQDATSIPSDIAKVILEGAVIVRVALEELTGYKLTDTLFSTLWSTLLDYLSNLFHSKGLAVVAAINDFLSGKANPDAPLEGMVVGGAAKIRAAAAIPEMGEILEQAVIDILTERSGPAFEWLSKVCERFVALCSLGLESTSTDEIRRVISRHKLVLDSDIVITILCASEPGHKPTKEILARWIRLGGKILLAAPVLEEVAYHAYISDREFHETNQLAAAGLKGVDLRRYCNNAFVRAFYGTNSDHNQWPAYRDMYAGTEPHDYSKLLEIVRELILSEFMPPTFDDQLALDIKKYLLSRSPTSEQSASDYFGDPGRLGRDGQLLATIADLRKRERESGSDARVVLLSSSSRLRAADRKFRDNLGSPEAVISRGALSYLISLVPEAGLSVGALRKALFDFGETAHLADTERFALRVIKTADSYVMPWAQRGYLRRQLETNLRKEAEKTGVQPKQFKIDFLAAKDKAQTATLIAQTIKEMALADPDKVKMRQEIGKLKRSLEGATAQLGKQNGRRKRHVKRTRPIRNA